jgi:hypothetical protein
MFLLWKPASSRQTSMGYLRHKYFFEIVSRQYCVIFRGFPEVNFKVERLSNLPFA